MRYGRIPKAVHRCPIPESLRASLVTNRYRHCIFRKLWVLVPIQNGIADQVGILAEN